MMMLINTSSTTNRIVYQDTVTKSLCNATIYHYSFSVINIDRPSDCQYGRISSVFEYRIEDGNGNLVKKIPQRAWCRVFTPDQYPFNTYGFLTLLFRLVLAKLVPKLTLLHSTYFVLKTLRLMIYKYNRLGPKVKIAFDNEPPTTIVKVFATNKMQQYRLPVLWMRTYNVPSLQWQREF